jgi:CHAT domain-containing protein/Tfp pilus assembly protein PilF
MSYIIAKHTIYKVPDSAFVLAQIQHDYAKEVGNERYMADALNFQGAARFLRSRYPEAIDLFNKSLTIRIQLGRERDAAGIHNNLGAIYQNIGEFQLSLDHFEAALKIFEDVNNESGIGAVSNNLAILYKNFGENELARKHYLRALEIARKQNDKRRIASALNNLATLYQNEADYPRALENYTKSLELSKEIDDQFGITTAYAGIGSVYKDMGDVETAEKYFRDNLKLRIELGEKRKLAQSYSALGHLFRGTNNLDSALHYYSKAEVILEEIKDQQSLAMIYSSKSAAYKNSGAKESMDKARDLLLKAFEIQKSISDVYGQANSYGSIGDLYRRDQEFILAIENSKKGFMIAKGVNNFDAIRYSGTVLFLSYCASDSMDQGKEIIIDLVDRSLQSLDINFAIQSERDKELYFDQLNADFNYFNDFILNTGDSYPELHAKGYDHALLTKGLLLKSSTAMMNAIISSNDSALIDHYDQWISLKKRIARAFAMGNDTDSLESKAQLVEKLLVKESHYFQKASNSQKINWRQVRESLEINVAAIEFVHFGRTVDYTIDSAQNIYAAFILTKNMEQPRLIPLFNEYSLKQILDALPGNNLSYIEQLYGTKENTKSQLYDLIWKPLEPHLEGIEKVYVSPIGLLHKISFMALAKGQNVFLCDNYDVEMMSSTGNLALAEAPEINSDSRYTLFGGIEYNSDSTTSEIWSYLDGSFNETEKIERTLSKANRNVSYYNLGQATEKQLKETASESNILHIATHGFFYEDPDVVFEASVDDIESTDDLVFRGGTSGMGVNTFVRSRNPLMRSGLVFAGANDVWNRTSIEGEDGVLTAAEVATIDMRNTELVVLSACETGLGDIKGSEGVYGLQRSFKMAGVNYIIMSLWQVPDKETAEFMTTFYKKLIESDDIKKAFKETQLEMRKKYDPYYWAAFVLIE